MTKKRLRVPVRFLKFYPKQNAWLRRLLPIKTYEFYMFLCYAMSPRQRYHPAISMKQTYKDLMKEPSDQIARKAVGVLKQRGIIRLIRKRPECWEVNPTFCTKSKFLSGQILEGWSSTIEYDPEFERSWNDARIDKLRNNRQNPVFDDLPTHVDQNTLIYEDPMLLKEMEYLKDDNREIKALLLELLGKFKKYEPEEAAKIERHLKVVREEP